MQPKLTRIPRNLVSCFDYQKVVGDFIDASSHAFLEAGAADELTLESNQSAFRNIRLGGRVLQKVAGGNCYAELFGKKYSHPILIAPIGYHKLFHTQGERETALAANATETIMTVSALSNTTIEDIAKLNGNNWFQIYLNPNKDENLKLINRAEKCGYSAIVVTIDAPLSGVRNREQRAGFTFPADLKPVNLNQTNNQIFLEDGQSVIFDGYMNNAPEWSDIKFIADNTKLPMVVKGILHPEDAKLAVDNGAKGIVVSNHGGRIMDCLPSSLEALPVIANAIGTQATILMDGGIRRGSDVFKAIALGANAVMVGRPYIYGLSVAGALGAAHILRTLREELEITMAISGAKTLNDINRDLLYKKDISNLL